MFPRLGSAIIRRSYSEGRESIVVEPAQSLVNRIMWPTTQVSLFIDGKSFHFGENTVTRDSFLPKFVFPTIRSRKSTRKKPKNSNSVVKNSFTHNPCPERWNCDEERRVVRRTKRRKTEFKTRVWVREDAVAIQKLSEKISTH